MNSPKPPRVSLDDAVEALIDAVPDARHGLPDPIFYYVSRTTPLINVDLLVKDDQGRTLLAWRHDLHAGTGWHVPGGIIRFQETIAERIEQVARQEIGVPVRHGAEPIAVHEMIHRNRAVRGHFISLLFACRLDTPLEPNNAGRGPRDPGYLQWHATCPTDMIAVHEVYRKYIG